MFNCYGINYVPVDAFDCTFLVAMVPQNVRDSMNKKVKSTANFVTCLCRTTSFFWCSY
jgi:hypothetical protein